MVSLRAGTLLSVAVATLLSCAGCKRSYDVPPPTFEVAIKVESDPNRPLGGVGLFHQDRELASTGADGRARVTLEGRDGEVTEISVKCPAANRQPSPLAIALRRFEGGKISEYEVACPPLVRRAIVGIRAENGPNLPVVFLGNVVARTDASGAAHFALDVKPGESFDVQLATETKPKLLPRNPSRTFVMPPHDEILVFSQSFSGEKKKPVYRGSPKPGGPKRM